MSAARPNLGLLAKAKAQPAASSKGKAAPKPKAKSKGVAGLRKGKETAKPTGKNARKPKGTISKDRGNHKTFQMTPPEKLNCTVTTCYSLLPGGVDLGEVEERPSFRSGPSRFWTNIWDGSVWFILI